MAPKKPASDKLPPPPPPQAEEEEEEESSDDEEEGSEEEEEEESESEEENNTLKTPQIQPQSQVNKNSDVQKKTTAPPPQSQSDSEGEDEEEEEEGAPHSPSASNFIMKPITPTKPAAKDPKPTSKRPAEAQKDDKKDARSQKKAKVDGDVSKKNNPSAVKSAGSASGGGGAGRVWSDEDIVGLLQSLIAFKDEKGTEPSADMACFSEFVKGKLSAEFSKVQIYEKIRRLKNKFFNYVKKSENEDPIFSSPFEAEAFELSKKIWGGGAGDGKIADGVDDNVNGKRSKSIGKAKNSGKVAVNFVDTIKKDNNKEVGVKELVKEDEKEDVTKKLVRDRDDGDFVSKYPLLSHSLDVDAGKSMVFAGSFLKENMSLIGDAKAKELEGRWKKLRETEAEVLLEKLDLMKEHTKLVLEGIRKK